MLVHSPLVGALTWRSVAGLFSEAGWQCVVPDLAGALDEGPPYYAALAARVAGAVPEGIERIVLVGHSFSGALLPLVSGAAALVYVDAGLPEPGKSWFDTVPPEFAGQVRAMARDGFLPPWHEWFPSDAIAEILPDAELRERFTSEIRGLPLGLFEEPQPQVADRAASHGYVLLSTAYSASADQAERRGWPTLRVEADHLAMLTRPKLVADNLETLLDALP